VTNTNKLVNILNTLKAQKYKGRIITSRKSSVIRRLLRVKEKESKIL